MYNSFQKVRGRKNARLLKKRVHKKSLSSENVLSRTPCPGLASRLKHTTHWQTQGS
jgi:hypothetical protein